LPVAAPILAITYIDSATGSQNTAMVLPIIVEKL